MISVLLCKVKSKKYNIPSVTIITAFNRCSAIIMPQRMLGQMEGVAAQQLEDEEKFKKIQLVDQTNFEDQLDTLNVSWTKQFLFC